MVLVQYGTTIMILYDSGAVVWPGWDPFAPASLDRHGASALEAGWHFHVLQEHHAGHSLVVCSAHEAWTNGPGKVDCSAQSIVLCRTLVRIGLLEMAT